MKRIKLFKLFATMLLLSAPFFTHKAFSAGPVLFPPVVNTPSCTAFIDGGYGPLMHCQVSCQWYDGYDGRAHHGTFVGTGKSSQEELIKNKTLSGCKRSLERRTGRRAECVPQQCWLAPR